MFHLNRLNNPQTPDFSLLCDFHLDKLHEVLEVHLLIDGELPVVVDDAIVLHFALRAHTECVVSGVVGALTHQEQPRLRRVKQSLGLFTCYLTVEPSEENRAKYTLNTVHDQHWAAYYIQYTHGIYCTLRRHNSIFIVSTIFLFLSY